MSDGEFLKRIGMKKAIDHADQKIDNWSIRAFYCLKIYLVVICFRSLTHEVSMNTE